MKAKIMLADLVLLQMEGYLNRAMTELEQNNDILGIINEAKENSSNPELYKGIVNKSIVNQFGDKHISLRELGQNAKDAYDAGDTKTVDFSIEETDADYKIKVRDYGKGMTPQSLIRDLLIPYNSSKFLDSDKIGEHGIGWYSIMDLSYKVEVVTSKDNKLSKAKVFKSGNDWITDIEVIPGGQKGTLVISYVKKGHSNPDLIKSNLEKHLGLVPSKDVNIKLNGEKINNFDRHYSNAVALMINYKSRKDRFKISYRKNVDKKFKTIRMTQDGLYIGDIENPFVKKTMHYDLLNTILESGVNLWIDLPKNIGLTKGRKEVVKKDRNIYYQALTRVFESVIYHKILEDDELVIRMDNDLGYVFKNIFFDSYDLKSSLYFRNNKPFDFDSMVLGEPEGYINPLEGFKLETIEEEKEYLKRAMKYFNEITHFNHEIFSKQFISVQKVLNGRHSLIKASPNDLIKIDLHGLLSESDMSSMPTKDGIFVDKDSKLAYAILNQIKVVKMTENKGNEGDVSSSSESQDLNVKRIPFSLFKSKLEKAGIGREYISFFNAVKYLDGIMQSAVKHPVTELFFLVNSREDKICPDESGIGFNFYSESLLSIINAVSLNKADRETFYKILDLYLYAKTYIVTGKYYITLEEVEEFYERTKKEIRDSFVDYVFENDLQIENELSNILTQEKPGHNAELEEVVKILN